ncbi:transcription factor LHW-like [Lotus japonicus]|uniref:transcription factor LHW-like n=1 Tax=Lotus japonicus TaxID=34305 RepID=UPI002588A3D8|nr:transcription factor LHW-like [Lotus japonicus]XP_057457482.1 transcription factor LHW-like [Lotus japonicus]
MGFLLKEALKSLCDRNQWSYAVFWKIGCQNSKLLIWEDCYYEPLPCPFPPRNFGTSSQLGIQEEDRVGSLINKMAVNNSVVVAGEGMIGRAAFSGSHQWILLYNFTTDAYPPEVNAEVFHQISAGMQTVAVIPVLPHGVVQLGSFLPIMENLGFLNGVKSLILQLGCVPGALLSEDYSAKRSNERLTGPSASGVALSVDPPVITSSCTPSVAIGSNQRSSSSHASGPIVRTLGPLRGEINTCQAAELTSQKHNPNQISNNLCQPKLIPVSKASFAGQWKDRAVEVEVIPSNLGSSLQQHSVSNNARSAFNNFPSCGAFSQSGLSDHSLKHMEQQIMEAIRSRDNVNNPSIDASSTLNMSQQTDGDHVLGHNLSSGSTPLLRGIPVRDGMSSLLIKNLITSSKSPKVSTADLSGPQEIGSGLQHAFSMPLEGSDQKISPGNLKYASTDLKIDYDLLQEPDILPFHVEEHVRISGQIPGLAHDFLHKDSTAQSTVTMNRKHEQAIVQPPSGDDLFDVFGVDFRNKLLNGDWNELLAYESNCTAENMVNKEAYMNMQGRNSDCYSVHVPVSESGIFSGIGTDHLLDAVVSKAKPITRQNSDDMSCWTTVTGSSTSSVPSPVFKKVGPGHLQGGLFNFSKNGGKTGTVETSSLRSRCSKDDAGKSSPSSAIYGSQLSSWIENVGGDVKCENSVSTGYSKQSREAGKSNRKRLKLGENPRPRPKDRQMIQDRVKELRELVPNGEKCSIDALLERTIKHMRFMQSVTKHADKLKQTGESKIISKEGGLLLEDIFEGATRAYELGSQSMFCPLIVEDLDPPRRMLVEMLCEERGFFLEIADFIRGLGLTILKGVMEAHGDKIWARFAVEANRDITRMEIFMPLVHLLDQQ